MAADKTAALHPAPPPTYKVVSLFSGCGGLDLGFHGGFDFLGKKYASHPFEVIWANDNNRAATRTYEHNLGSVIKYADIWDGLPTLPATADVAIGGFPCQDISVNGTRTGLAGAKSGLYRAMVDAVAHIRPKMFVAENVKGLLMKYNQEALQIVVRDFSALGYRVSFHLYNAADYGVPQTRERTFIVGTADGVAEFKHPHAVLSKAEWICAERALGDLVDLAEDAEWSHIWSRANRSPEQGNRRLAADRPGYTIRAECHGNIQWHYSLPRRISMREAARIQSFPDDFRFVAKLRETERQIGNAVPPVLAWHIASAVKECLEAELAPVSQEREFATAPSLSPPGQPSLSRAAPCLIPLRFW